MHSSQLSPLALSLLLAVSPASSTSILHCDNLVVDKHTFDLSALTGPHSVVTSRYNSIADNYHNTTYTLDICRPLKKTGSGKKGEECPNGTQVCAITRLLKDDVDTIDNVIAIAGALEDNGGTQFEYQATRLKTSDSNSDSQKEGVRLVLKGGREPLEGKDRRDQRAVIEFLCNSTMTGLEGEWRSEDRYDGDDFEQLGARDEKDDKGDEKSSSEHQLLNDGAALVWESYGPDDAEKNVDTLRLTWYTKHACESKEDSGDDDRQNNNSHWGFFTWFIIIVFLGVSAYLIFGSWLNYTRYGARGWDLLPHGDTLRDIPYLLKDWTRQVLNTVQGTGSRGGYSAV
uniref:Autophagy-related protein 27 n=1 Tax=Bionectria ochroleuca TaxID=29856 RepID=A0A0B7JTZ7_BIOOC